MFNKTPIGLIQNDAALELWFEDASVSFYDFEYLLSMSSEDYLLSNCFAIIVSNYILVGTNFQRENHAKLCCLLRALIRNNPELEALAESATNSKNSATNSIRILNSMSPSLMSTLEVLVKKSQESSSQRAMQIWCVNGYTLEVFLETLLPVTDCPGCRLKTPSNIAKELANCEEEQRSLSPSRSRSINQLIEPLFKGCVGRNVGIVQEYAYDLQMPFGSCSAWSSIRKERREPTLGRSNTFLNARTLSLIEALERNAGIFGGQYREIETEVAAYEEIKDNALNPVDIGLHEDHLYDLPDYPFTRFNPDEKIEWVKGYDLTSNTDIWIPYCFSFYGPSRRKGVHLAYETSNGCATGSTLNEAILHGLFELIERDAFLYHWYQRIPPRKLSLDVAWLDELRPVIARAEMYTNANLELFDTTREHGVPSVIAALRSDESNSPATAISAGAGLSYVGAVSAAIYELVGHFLRMKSNFQDAALVEELRCKYAHPEKVRTMEDHGLVNALPEARGEFDVFLSGSSSKVIDNVPFKHPGKTPSQVLTFMVDRLGQRGLRVLAVKQTTQALSAYQLNAAKVIVPGMIPMTFGHDHRRTALAQLEHLPQHELTPHPFP